VRAALARFAKSSWRLVVALLLSVPLFALTNCEPRLPSSAASPPIVSPVPVVAGDVWLSRGRVVRQEPYDPPFDDPASVLGQAWRAVYISVSGVDGGSREVSGAFFVPRGNPPENGWPVISFAHGTTGIGNNCGPAQQPDLQGYSPIVEALLANKYAVALTDYEGLGEQGSHFYLEPRTAAFNTIDAVRAMRDISPAVSSHWVAVGHSQGGQAVWAANELNSYYGDGLQLDGSVALAPAANVTGVADLAWSRSLTDEQRALLPLVIVGVARYTPGLDVHSFLRGAAQDASGWMRRCEVTDSPPPTGLSAPVPWQGVVDRVSESNDLRPATSHDVAALRDALRRVALPQRSLGEPMLVITGLRDALVLPGWVESAVSQSCELGGRVEYLEVPDADHNEVVWKRSRIVMQWIADRFAGLAAPSNCPGTQQ
jgi:dienelactone hydrolase